jgi:ribosomal protein L29
MNKVDIIRKHIGSDDFYDINGTSMLTKILAAMEDFSEQEIESKIKPLKQEILKLRFKIEELKEALPNPVVVGQVKKLVCYHEGSYTLNKDGTCCKCHRLPKKNTGTP